MGDGFVMNTEDISARKQAEQHLQEVKLVNLLSNAVKYSQQGGTVGVRVLRSEGEAVVEVQDQGIGVPLEALERLFMPFYRASNVGSQTSGFGLGLYIVREIVQRHNGHIAIESTEGEDSTFRVTLPLSATSEGRA